MDLKNENIFDRGNRDANDPGLENCAKEVFFESLRMLNKFSMDELDGDYIDDVSE